MVGKNLKIPRRTPSVVIPPPKVVYITPDKTTCKECGCFPAEEPYQKPKKLRPCQRTPASLSELAGRVVDAAPRPKPFTWGEAEVVQWLSEYVGLPQYAECILDNKINGRRLLMLEDPSKLPLINIHDFQHIKIITRAVRSLFFVERALFARSIGLPPRRPSTHTTWFHSRTGPSWGVRENWNRTDILRWMKILDPKPVFIDHWDAVWYLKPEFPSKKIARVAWQKSNLHVPHYVERKDICWEYQLPRKFRLQTGIAEEDQLIWMERRRASIIQMQQHARELRRLAALIPKPREYHVYPKKVTTEGKSGTEFILARRLMPKKKFLNC